VHPFWGKSVPKGRGGAITQVLTPGEIFFWHKIVGGIGGLFGPFFFSKEEKNKAGVCEKKFLFIFGGGGAPN